VDVQTARHLAGVLADRAERGGNAPAGYQLVELLGEGASGRVYLASRDGSERVVALKIMKGSLGDGKNTQRAWRELELLGRVRSPHLPALLDHGTHEGRLFIATEFVEGAPIDLHVESAAADRRARVELLAKVCEAAGELHNHGVIHRDLKPSNILVTPAGEPVIIDLGIAAILSSDVMQTLTAEGAPIGTPAYMAPEQARGDRDAVGVRSDVWALGAVSCRVLTGQPPHDLTAITIYDAVRRVGADPPRDPAELDPSLPRPLAAVISKACAARPGDRYATATELAADLRRWLRREPVEAQPPGPWVRAMRWMMRHPVLSTAGLCAAMVGVSVVASTALYYTMVHEPFSVAVNTDQTQAWIESRTRRPLATLRSGSGRGKPVLAARIDRPTELGGGWLAVVTGPIKGTGISVLSAYDPRKPNEPVWTAPAPGPFPRLALPSYESESARAEHLYYARLITVADIFPSTPGDEIACFDRGTPDFPSCLRVFTSSGQEVYRAWIPGHGSIQWLEADGVFVIAGPNHRLFTPTWDGLDTDSGDRPGMFANGVLMLRPRQGQIAERWLTYKSPGSQTNVDRCWVLRQPATHRPDAWTDGSPYGFEVRVTPAGRDHDPRRNITLELIPWRNGRLTAVQGATWIVDHELT
jgi:tRNA A-37 threonylcarbamoyl transferase component Bud32